MNVARTHPLLYQLTYLMHTDAGGCFLMPNDRYTPSLQTQLMMDGAEAILRDIWHLKLRDVFPTEKHGALYTTHEMGPPESKFTLEQFLGQPLYEVLAIGEWSFQGEVAEALGPSGAYLNSVLEDCFDGDLAEILTPQQPDSILRPEDD